MKKLSRRDFLKLTGLAVVGVAASQIPVKDKPNVIHAQDATLSIDGETTPMDLGGYAFDIPELEDEAIHTLTVSKNTMLGKEFTITSVSPFYDEDELFGIPIKFFPDKDSDFHLEGRIVDYDAHNGIVTAEFNYGFNRTLNEVMKDSGSWNKLFDKET
jgi:hypothetical protein